MLELIVLEGNNKSSHIKIEKKVLNLLIMLKLIPDFVENNFVTKFSK